nr:methyltransferase domain-containing protein [Clostridiales bacterium]
MIKLNDREYQTFINFTKSRFGIDLEGKRELIESRLSFDLERNGYTSFTKYIELIMAQPNGVECQKMLNKITTNHTYFFREDDHFHHLQKIVIPEIAKRNLSYSFNIWSAASSSGQEPYTAAMVVDDAIKKLRLNWTWSIIGSDISMNVLTKAKAGIYPANELEAIPSVYHQYCKVNNANYTFEVSNDLKRNMNFKIQNLMEPFPYKDQFDIVFCRNVMIYFDKPTREQLIANIYKTVKPGGYLYVGTTESI